MRTRVTILVAAALAMTAALSTPTHAGMLVGSSYGVIYDIDSSTGAASNPRDVGDAASTIGFANGTLYGESALSLYVIDVATGAAELIGNLGGLEAPQVVRDLAWDPTTETLFALIHVGGTTHDDLFTIDITSLEASEIGRLDHSYEAIACTGNGTLLGIDPFVDVLGTIEKAHGTTTSIMALASDVALGPEIAVGYMDLIYVETTLEGSPNALHVLDPYTGALTSIGSTGLEHGLWSLSYVPEPTSVALLSIGCLACHGRKRRKRLRSATVAIAIFAGLTVPTQAGTLVGSSYGVLYDIDVNTGVASNPRDTGLSGLAIAFGDGRLYGASAQSLYRLDLVTGQADLIGQHPGIEPPVLASDLAWDPTSHSLFEIMHVGGTTGFHLYTTDTSTADLTEVGLLDDAYTTMAFDSSGTLFALERVNDVLATIDKVRAETLYTVAIDSDIVLPVGMTFDDTGALFVANGVGQDPSVLHLLNPDTGVMSPAGSTGLDHRVFSLAYVPEPGSLALLGIACLGLRARKRRKALRSAIVAIAIVAGLTVPTEAGTLVGSSFGVIYDIDPLTGVASNPRDTGGSVGRIEFGNGTLYGASVRSLYAVDILTGEAEFLGELDGLEVPQLVYDMAWDETTDSLFALVHTGGTTLDELYTIDTATLEVRGVGRLDDRYDALAFDPNGGLFGIDPLNDILGTIDKTNAETTSTLALTPQLDLGAAMTFGDGGALYVVTNVGEDPCVLHVLDPQNGVLTPIGTTGLNDGISSLAYIPDPGTLLLLATGAITITRSRVIA